MKNLVKDFTNNICTCVLYTESFGEDFKSFSKTRNNKLPMIAIFWYIKPKCGIIVEDLTYIICTSMSNLNIIWPFLVSEENICF
jgi:hypothetical protein